MSKIEWRIRPQPKLNQKKMTCTYAAFANAMQEIGVADRLTLADWEQVRREVREKDERKRKTTGTWPAEIIKSPTFRRLTRNHLAARRFFHRSHPEYKSLGGMTVAEVDAELRRQGYLAAVITIKSPCHSVALLLPQEVDAPLGGHPKMIAIDNGGLRGRWRNYQSWQGRNVMSVVGLRPVRRGKKVAPALAA